MNVDEGEKVIFPHGHTYNFCIKLPKDLKHFFT